MILTWVGIAVMVIVLVAWVIYENRRLLGALAGVSAAGTPIGSGRPPQDRRLSPEDGRRPMSSNGSTKKQIEFLPLQTHVKAFERAMLAISIFWPSWSW